MSVHFNMNTERVVHKLFMYTSRTSEHCTDPALNSLNFVAFSTEKLASWLVKNQQTRESMLKRCHTNTTTKRESPTSPTLPEACGYIQSSYTSPEVNPPVEFMSLGFTRMPGESYRRRLRSSWLCLCDESYHRQLRLWLCLCDIFVVVFVWPHLWWHTTRQVSRWHSAFTLN